MAKPGSTTIEANAQAPPPSEDEQPLLLTWRRLGADRGAGDEAAGPAADVCEGSQAAGAEEEAGSAAKERGQGEEAGAAAKERDVGKEANRATGGSSAAAAESEPPQTPCNGNYMKPNVLLLGPTGSGKTYLMKNLAELVGVPFVKADATKFSETGYVGRNAEDVLQDLLTAADGDVSLAQLGIVYVDEIDKVAADQSGGSLGNFRRGVQNTFLKLMEEADVSVPLAPPQVPGQPSARLSTRYILFVFSGAFTELNKRLREEKGRKAFGFGLAAEAGAGVEVTDAEMTSFLHDAGTDELVDAGLEPEFVGRIPVRVALGALSEDDLFRILSEAEGGAGAQLAEDFRRYGVRLVLTEEALRAIAKRAVKEKTGARSLVTVLENTLRRFKFRLPALVPRGCGELVVTASVVEHPEEELEQLVLRYGAKSPAKGAEDLPKAPVAETASIATGVA